MPHDARAPTMFLLCTWCFGSAASAFGGNDADTTGQIAAAPHCGASRTNRTVCLPDDRVQTADQLELPPGAARKGSRAEPPMSDPKAAVRGATVKAARRLVLTPAGPSLPPSPEWAAGHVPLAIDAFIMG